MTLRLLQNLEEEFLIWQNMTLRRRIELCAECGDSIFAARHYDSIPGGVYEYFTKL